MATKIILATKNSSWGLKVDHYGNLSISHIVNWSTEEIRWKFLDKFLFNGEDGKKLLSETEPRAMAKRDSDTIEFTINWFEYPNETQDTLLRKDFAIMEEDGVYSYWFVRGVVSGEGSANIDYVGKRDWVFELGVENMFVKTRLVELFQGHTFDIDGELWNVSNGSDNFYSEEFDDALREGCFITDSGKTKKLEVEFTTGNENTIINQIPIMIVYFTPRKIPYTESADATKTATMLIERGETNTTPKAFYFIKDWRESSGIIQQITPVSVGETMIEYAGDISEQGVSAMYIIGYPHTIESDFNLTTNPSADIQKIYNTIQLAVGDNQYIKNIMMAPFNILPSNLDYSIQGGRLFIEGSDKTNVLKATALTRNGHSPNDPMEDGLDTLEDREMFNVMFMKKVGETTQNFQVGEINIADYDTTSKHFVRNNIGKLHQNPYTKYTLRTHQGGEYPLIQQFVKNKVGLRASFSWNPEYNRSMYKWSDLDNEDGLYNQDFKYGMYLMEQETPNMPTQLSKYTDYINQNAAFVNQQMMNLQQTADWDRWGGVVNILSGLITTAIGVMGVADITSGSMSGVVGTNMAVQGIQQVVGGARQIALRNQQIKLFASQLSSMKSAPRSINGSKSDADFILQVSDYQPTMFYEELQPALKEMIAWRFQMFGVNLAGNPKEINQYLHNKEWFNFLRTGSIFENFNLNLTDYSKQIIDRSFQNGVHIWHLDDETFDDFEIKNYDKNNIDRRS